MRADTVPKPTAEDLRKPFGVNEWVLRYVIEAGWAKALSRCSNDPKQNDGATFTEITLVRNGRLTESMRGTGTKGVFPVSTANCSLSGRGVV